MFIFFQAQLCNILYFFIYLFSFFESKINLFKRNFIVGKDREIFYYKHKQLLANEYNNNDEINIIDYDVKIVIEKDENDENKKCGKIYTNTQVDEKNEIIFDKLFLNIEINILENDIKTPYVISLKNPINYYYTNSELFIYEHLHFLMKRIHSVNITPDTLYEIIIMDNDINIVNITNNQYIMFADNFNYSIVRRMNELD